MSSDRLPEELDARHLRRRALQLALVVVLVGLAIMGLPGLGGVRRHLADAQPVWLAVAIAAELASALSYVAILRAVFCPCMRWRLSLQLGMSELAADSLLPAGGAGGLALGAWALRRGGMPVTHIARRTVAFFLLTSAANFAAVIFAGAGVALGALPGRTSLGLAVAPVIVATVAVSAVLALPLLLHRARAPGTVVSQGVRMRLRRFLARIAAEVRAGMLEVRPLLSARRSGVMVGSVGYMAFDIATLAACFRATGSVPPFGILVLAYAIGQLGGLVPVPGGLGPTDGGLIGAFVLYGAALGPVTAAVVIYRLLQLGLPALLGVPAFALLRRNLRSADLFSSLCAPAEDGMGARTHGLLPAAQRP